jgi:small subunit ribosomal protein S13
MARLFGTDIPNEKRIEASLPYIFGIGPSTASKILDHAGVSPDIRTGELSEEQLVKIATVIQNEGILIEGDLRREKQGQMKRLSSINCYRGIRHKRGLRSVVSAPAQTLALVRVSAALLVLCSKVSADLKRLSIPLIWLKKKTKMRRPRSMLLMQ